MMGSEINAYWKISISLIFAYILYNIYIQHKKGRRKSNASGIKYLIIALLIWVLSGTMSAVYYAYFETTGNVSLKIAYYFLVTIFSIGNSAFILLAIPSIEVEKIATRNILKKDIKTVSVYAIIILLGTMAIAFLILDVSDFSADKTPDLNEFLKQPIYFVGILDLLFAFIVIWELIIRMIQAFKERNMNFMIPVSWMLIAFIFISKMLEVLPAFILNFQEWNSYLMLQHFSLLAYKILLIALFILLLYSWQLKNNKASIEKIKIKQKREIFEKDKNIKTLKDKINRYKVKIEYLKNAQKEDNKNERNQLKITDDDLEKLTEREKEVFERLAKDLSYRDIGKELYIARDTVISNIRSIEKKLGLKRKENLVRAAKSVFHTNN